MILAQRCIDADDVMTALDKVAGERGAPTYIRLDNGPDFIANVVADWCRFNATGIIFIDRGSPWRGRTEPPWLCRRL